MICSKPPPGSFSRERTQPRRRPADTWLMLHTQWLLVALVALRTGQVHLDALALEVARVMPLGRA